MIAFCKKNGMVIPSIEAIPASQWHVGACAFYRRNSIYICLEHCAHPAKPEQVRNWSWPGCVTDREPFGVICHELGHHIDLCLGKKRGAYFSDFGENMMRDSGELPITSYAPNPAEWFAEMARLFITNAALLEKVRPKTYWLFRQAGLEPVSNDNWEVELGGNVPTRIHLAQRKKFAPTRSLKSYKIVTLQDLLAE